MVVIDTIESDFMIWQQLLHSLLQWFHDTIDSDFMSTYLLCLQVDSVYSLLQMIDWDHNDWFDWIMNIVILEPSYSGEK